MLIQPTTVARRAGPSVAFAIALLAVFSPSAVRSQTADFDVVRVEEDWVLEVRIPDPGTNAPQVCSVIAPTGNIEYGYAEFDINHHSVPAYRPGGLQLQVWSGGQPIIVNNDPDGGVLTAPDETVSWTQAMSIEEGVLTFSIINGRSDTWSNFGHDGRLAIRAAAGLSNLNGYDSAVSVSNSGAGFAGNRVRSLRIAAVRRYAADGRVIVDDEPHVVISNQ